MRNLERIARAGFLFTLIAMAAGCIVAEPREGYWDRDHHRYYHEHTWHECGDRDDHCH